MTGLLNPDAVAGHNGAPEPTPYELSVKRIDDLYGEADLWLDGQPVESQEMCDGLSNLQRLIDKAGKEADAARRTENEPFDAGKAEVQARYNPLLAKVKRAIDGLKQAQRPWLLHVDAENARIAREKQEVADALAAKAQEALRATSGSLAGREAAERIETEAKGAERDATRAGKAKASAGGTVGRATGLRTVYVAEVTDITAFSRYAWTEDRAAVEEFMRELAAKMVRNGLREAPGLVVREEKVV